MVTSVGPSVDIETVDASVAEISAARAQPTNIQVNQKIS